jgi:hypothetical protein
MSEFRVDTITDRVGTGSPNFPNGLTLNGVVPVSNTPTWSETGTSASASATDSRIITRTYSLFPKNLIINGDMNIHQRSNTTVSSISTSGYYTADRWHTEVSMSATSGVFSQVVDTADPPPNTEFKKSLKVNCTTAKTSLAVGDIVKINHKFEGTNLQVLKKGTSNPEVVTISFWVRSNLNGTYIVELDDTQNSRQVSKSYVVSDTNWQKISLTFPADNTGSLTNDSSSRFQIAFWLSAGATYTGGTLNNSAWASYTNGNRATWQANLASSTSNYWQVTGVQMELGTIANDFEYKSYSEQLSLCQRYYSKFSSLSGNYVAFGSGVCNTSTGAAIYVKYPVRMRGVPVPTQSNTAIYDGSTQAVTSIGTSYYGDESSFFNLNVASGLTTGRGCIWSGNNNASAFIELNAELT